MNLRFGGNNGPGPTRIEPGRVPTGLLVHFYSWPAGDLLLERPLDPGNLERGVADADASFVASVAHSAVWVVIYDGDTGERMMP